MKYHLKPFVYKTGLLTDPYFFPECYQKQTYNIFLGLASHIGENINFHINLFNQI